MKKKFLFAKLFLMISCYSFSQGVGIGTNTPNTSAALDITSNNKGLLIPRMNTAAMNAIVNPATGLMIYDSEVNQLMINLGTPAAPNFQRVSGNGSNGAWSLTGNSGINPANQFIGTTDNQPLRFRINNIRAGELNPSTGNIFWGLRAGQSNTTGFSNVAIGTDALKSNISIGNLIAIGDSALFNNIGTDNGNHIDVGIDNVAIGHQSLFNNTTGQFNVAIGQQSLFTNTTGPQNVAIGFQALFSNTIANSNTAIGQQSLFSNITGDHNTATGFLSLFSNISGDNNTATGFEALHSNTSGNANTALGNSALFGNTTGTLNTAVGVGALNNGTTGNNNTAIGASALAATNSGDRNTAVGVVSLGSNLTGNSNTAIGANALSLNSSGKNNVALGDFALRASTASDNNTAIGSHAAFNFNMGTDNTIVGANADADRAGLINATAIGAGAIVNASNKVRIGNSSVTVIEGQVPFTTPSDGRFKFNVKEDVKGLDFIMQLRPVTYQFDVRRFDDQWNNKSTVSVNNIMMASYNEATSIRRTGFIAQEVESAANATGYDFSGIIKPKTTKDHYSLSYESFVVPLVKAVQEQQQMIDELKKINSDQKSLNESLLNRLEKLESSLGVKK
jgi:trimeric autotransporter adhesin